jgi:hypothetical protein
MARLDAVLGRSPLDRAESSSPRESVPALWLDQDSPAEHEGTSNRAKGADKDARGRRRSPAHQAGSASPTDGWRAAKTPRGLAARRPTRMATDGPRRCRPGAN